MFIEIFRDSEYEVQLFCPRCGTKDVIVDHSTGFFTFEECLKCGFRKGQSEGRSRISGLEK